MTGADDTRLRMSFYQGSDGPRVMLFGPLNVNIRALQDYFQETARTGQCSRLDQQAFVIPIGGIEVTVRNRDHLRGFGNGYGIQRISSTSPHFLWTLRGDEWIELVELIDGMLDSSRPGHCYLDRNPGHEAIVVLSQGEYDHLDTSEETIAANGN